jgi:hypothetical protein
MAEPPEVGYTVLRLNRNDPAATEIFPMGAFDPTRYPAAVAALLGPPRLAELGPGTPNRSAKAALDSLTPEAVCPNFRDRSMALACLAGLWLYHDFLDESHRISQDIDTTTGSYWHGIMHRREPDASNAKYWFRNVGRHPVFEELAKEAAVLDYRGAGKEWDAFAFIDSCEEYRGTGSAEEEVLRRVQLREWELLFDWCYRQAMGA